MLVCLFAKLNFPDLFKNLNNFDPHIVKLKLITEMLERIVYVTTKLNIPLQNLTPNLNSTLKNAAEV